MASSVRVVNSEDDQTLTWLIGELEATMLTHSARYSNVCALLEDDDDLRRNMTQLINTTESIKNKDLHGFNLSAILSPSKTGFDIPRHAQAIRLHPDLTVPLKTLQDNLAIVPLSDPFELQHISHLGVRFAAFRSRNFRDSSIIFTPPSADISGHCEIPAVIQAIFAQQCRNREGHITVEVFLLLDEYRRIMDDGAHDPYVEFGFAAGYLCHQQPVGHRIIALRHIKCHFISTVIVETSYLHVLPMDKVSYFESNTGSDSYSSNS